jgi:S-adenosylmethionine hydrolase
VTGPFVSLLSDFGSRDPSAAIMRGVVLAIAPEARIVDISHDVRKYAIRDGALLLWCALPYLPVGSHVAVVDPGVGTARRPIGIATGRGDVLIGPDNGLLVAAARKLDGIVAVHELRDPRYRLPVISTSFHGRDIFAPAAAHLATGVLLGDLGPAVDPASLVPSPIADPIVEDGTLGSRIVYVDTFGNVKLAGLRTDLEAALGRLEPGDPLVLDLGPASGDASIRTTWQATFGDVGRGETLVYEDSYGRLCLAAREADAAAKHGLAEDRDVRIRRA